jgi:hypothetical protein
MSRHDDVGHNGKIVHRAGGQLEIHSIEIASPLAEEVPRGNGVARDDDG